MATTVRAAQLFRKFHALLESIAALNHQLLQIAVLEHGVLQQDREEIHALQ